MPAASSSAAEATSGDPGACGGAWSSLSGAFPDPSASALGSCGRNLSPRAEFPPTPYMLLWAFLCAPVSLSPCVGLCPSIIAYPEAPEFSLPCTGLHTQVLTGQAPVCPYPLGTQGLLGSQPVLIPGALGLPLGLPPVELTFLVYTSARGHCGCPGLLSPVPLVSASHTHVCGSLLCKYCAPHPCDTWALTHVFLASTPRTMFSLPAPCPVPSQRGRWRGGWLLHHQNVWLVNF